MCSCSPVSIKVKKVRLGLRRECRHCGDVVIEISKQQGSFLDEKPVYQTPWKKGKHGNPNKRKKRL